MLWRVKIDTQPRASIGQPFIQRRRRRVSLTMNPLRVRLPQKNEHRSFRQTISKGRSKTQIRMKGINKKTQTQVGCTTFSRQAGVLGLSKRKPKETGEMCWTKRCTRLMQRGNQRIS